ncbi:MAG: hypothetical protein B7Y42_13505 [Polaromonas sp. 28-63-22]|nr:MAG: hypothetical protein B7Y42_13505 [Polaromonas sp. 28-63-22]
MPGAADAGSAGRTLATATRAGRAGAAGAPPSGMGKDVFKSVSSFFFWLDGVAPGSRVHTPRPDGAGWQVEVYGRRQSRT